MKPIIFITTYCNTQEKLDILERNILNIRANYPEYEIGIHAHYPLSIEIQLLANHYIFDRANEHSTLRNTMVWSTLFDRIKLTERIEDYGYAALHQIKMITSYLQSLNRIEDVIIVNYDINTFDSGFDEFLYFCKDKSNVFFSFSPKLTGVSFVGMKFNKSFMQDVLKDVSLATYESMVNNTDYTVEDVLRTLLEEKQTDINFYHRDLSSKFLPSLFDTSTIDEMSLVDNEFIVRYFKKIMFVNNNILVWDINPIEFKIVLNVDGVSYEYMITGKEPLEVVEVNFDNTKHIKLTKINDVDVDHLVFDKELKNADNLISFEYLNK